LGYFYAATPLAIYHATSSVWAETCSPCIKQKLNKAWFLQQPIFCFTSTASIERDMWGRGTLLWAEISAFVT